MVVVPGGSGGGHGIVAHLAFYDLQQMIVTTNVSQSPGFAKYQGLIRTAESNFKKVPRPVSI